MDLAFDSAASVAKAAAMARRESATFVPMWLAVFEGK